MKESISLFYREGASDKVYHAQLEPSGSGWLVNIQYGRRGSTLATGSKTPHGAVPYENAKKAYDKVVKEKQSKGYTPYEGGTPYSATDKAGQVSGLLPQLLNPVGEELLERLLTDSRFCMQEKFDGKRMMIRKKGDRVDGINRKGLVVALPEPIIESALLIKTDCIIDGEAIGDTFYAFDIIEAVEDCRRLPYSERYAILHDILAAWSNGGIRKVETAWVPNTKRAMLASLKDRRAEGVVFKDIHAPYTIGRPNSGGPQLKHKFYATLSAVVDTVNEKRSVGLILFESNGEYGGDPVEPAIVPVGNVTIPPNREVPSEDTVVEVRYLYAFKGGSIYQPIYQGTRDDIEPAECTTAQLKFKPEGEEEA